MPYMVLGGGEEKIESHQPQHAKKKERRERKQRKDSGERSISGNRIRVERKNKE